MRVLILINSMDGGSNLRYIGRIVGLVVMCINSFVWYAVYEMVEGQEGSSLLFLFFLTVNALLGFMLGAFYDRVKRASLQDELTQAYNRRILQECIPGLLARTSRRRSCLSVTLVDCDDFKRINDQYGHAAGDMVLMNISRLLQQNTRANDLVVRWGGDEFLIIAYDADQKDTEAIMERLSVQLQELSEQMNIQLSVSVGTAVYPRDADQMEHLIQLADQNMYHLKAGKKEVAVC